MRFPIELLIKRKESGEDMAALMSFIDLDFCPHPKDVILFNAGLPMTVDYLIHSPNELPTLVTTFLTDDDFDLTEPELAILVDQLKEDGWEVIDDDDDLVVEPESKMIH